ncbi:MAG: Lpg1974 family pore-forming outer membrane protein [Parachlamydiales bacterium]
MKRWLLGLLLIGTAAGVEGQRTSYNLCYDPCAYWACGGFEIGVEALYLKPTSCDYEYAILDPRPFNAVETPTDLPQGKQRGIRPCYNWGFRVSAAYLSSLQCEDVTAQYTRFHNGNSADVNPGLGGLWPTLGHPRYMVETPLFTGVEADEIAAEADAKIHFDYDAADIEYGSRALVSRRRCVWLRTFYGLHYAWIDHRFNVAYQGTLMPGAADAQRFSTTVEWRRKSWGIGPRVGFDGRWESPCGVGLCGHIAFAALGGEARDRAFSQVDIVPVGGVPEPINETLSVRFCHRHQLFPYVDARLGVDYLLCRGRGYQILFEVSYEFHAYINTLRHYRFNDERGTGAANCTNFNLDGFSLSLNIRL